MIATPGFDVPMIEFFESSLTTYLQTTSRQDGGPFDWFVTRIRRWGATAEWRDAVRRLEAAEKIEVLAGLGRRVYDKDVANYRTNLELNLRHVRHVGGKRRELLREHCAFQFVSLLDPLILADDRARAAAYQDCEVGGVEQGDAALAGGRGAILLGCLQTHSGLGLQCPALAHWNFGFIRLAAGDDGYPLRSVEETYGQNVNLIPPTVVGVGRAIDWLAKNGCVAVQNDFSYPQTVGLPGALFGRPVVVSRSLVKLVLRTRAPVLPVNVVRLLPFESRRIRIEIHPPLPFDDLSESKADQRTAALRLSVATECLIRRYPVQWTHWSLLNYRWHEARTVFARRERLASG